MPCEPGVTGCPILDGATASFDCRLRQLHRAGDHLIVLGEVLALAHRPHLEPLIFHAGMYKSLERGPRAAGRAAARRFGQGSGVAGQGPQRRVA